MEPTARVVNVGSEAELAIHVDKPVGVGPFEAVVLVPGGTRDGATLLPEAAVGRFVDRGHVVVRYDPDGRGNSSGTEDLGVEVHQAALRSVIRHAIDRPEVGEGGVGVISFSTGISAAAGALAGGRWTQQRAATRWGRAVAVLAGSVLAVAVRAPSGGTPDTRGSMRWSRRATSDFRRCPASGESSQPT